MPGSLGLTPTELIGDFDSVEQQCIDDYPDMIIHRHKPDKDETDTELGIELLRKRGARRIHIVGGGGGRLDHLYALLSLFHRENPPDYWYTHREHIQLIQGEMLTYPGINRRVSFFPPWNRGVPNEDLRSQVAPGQPSLEGRGFRHQQYCHQ